MDQRLLDACARARCRAPADAVLTGVTALHLLRVQVGDPLPVRLATRTSAQTRDRTVRLHRLRALPRSVGGVTPPLVQQGYAGPAPTFSTEWVELFER